MDNLVVALKKALDAPKVDVRRHSTRRYNASGFGYCDRKAYYRRTATPGVEHRYLENDLILEVGEKIHEVVQARVDRALPGAATVEYPMEPIRVTPEEVEKYLGEAAFKTPVEVSGRADLILTLPEGRMGVFEVKSGKPELLSESSPRWSHRLQIGTYWRAIPADMFGYIYLDRESFRYRVHEEPDPEKMWVEVLRVINTIEGHILAGTKPDIGSDMCRRRCKSCENLEACFGR